MRDELHILIIDDNPDDRLLAMRAILKEFPEARVTEITDQEEFERALEAGGFDLVITDYHLGWNNGLEVLKTVKSSYPECPVIMFTGTGTEEVAVTAMKSGLDDYVVKTVSHLARLPVSINTVLRSVREYRARRDAQIFAEKIFEGVGEAISVVDRDFRILLANNAFCRMYGVHDETVAGRCCYEIAHGARRPCYESVADCPAKHSLETGEPYRSVHVHRDKEGRVFDVDVRSYPLKDEAGGTVSVIRIAKDITEQKNLEDQLRQAQKMEAVGRLAGGIAHDFNNILTAIIGYTNLLQAATGEDMAVREGLKQIEKAANRAAGLTNSLLAFSRQQIIQPKPVSLNDLVRKIEKMLVRIIGEDIELEAILCDKDPVIVADTVQIEQILMNLATNARDAMPEGGSLTIKTALVELKQDFFSKYGFSGRPGPYAMMTVKDTGLGMDPNTQKQIFEPFFTTKEVGKGTGLGLAITYGIVSQHKGFITVDSRPGMGTAFNVYFPATDISVKQDSGKEVQAITPGGLETILIVEDDQEVRNFFKTVLTDAGYNIMEAADGEEAVEVFKKNADQIDLILSDVVMPKKKGNMVFDEIRGISPSAKIIFISGYGAEVLGSGGIVEEGTNFLKKPVLPGDLLGKIREVLDS